MDSSATRETGYGLSSQQIAHFQEFQWNTAGDPAVLLEVASALTDGPHLRDALEGLIERHEVLRTSYRPVEGLRYPLQYIGAAACSWQDVASTVSDADLLIAARENVNPREGRIVSVAIAAHPSSRSRIALAVSGYSVDARSLKVLLHQWLLSGASEPQAVIEPGTIQYADYAAWQRDILDSDFGKEGAAFWRAQFERRASWPPFLTNTNTEHAHGAVETLCDAESVNTLLKLADQVDAPVQDVLLAAWLAFWSRISSNSEASVAWHCDGRFDEVKNSLGHFGSKRPFTIAIDATRSFHELVLSLVQARAERSSWQECLAAAEFPEAARDIDFEHVCIDSMPTGCALLRIEPAGSTAALKLEAIQHQNELRLRWRFHDRELAAWVAVWAVQFPGFLTRLCSESDRALSGVRVIDAVAGEIESDVGKPRSAALLHRLVQQQAESTPDAPAVVCGEARISYRELDRRAGRLARVLLRQGLPLETIVGVYLDRSVEAVVAILGVLKAGAAYLPLDPGYPAEHIASMLDDARCPVIVTDLAHAAQLTRASAVIVCIEEIDKVEGRELPAVAVSPENLAYMIYTSGSTGRPKGVMVSHANAVASTLARWDFYPERVRAFMLLSSSSFDSSVAGLFWTLSQGGALHVPAMDEHLDPATVAALVRRESISHLLAVPTFYSHILQQLDQRAGLRCVIVAGEVCPPDLAQAHFAKFPKVAFVNEYGPTEGTVWCTAHAVDFSVPGTGAANSVPIGNPISSARVAVLDEHLERCAIGIPGELHVGGSAITRGYRNRAGLTAGRFIADPIRSGERLYRTGDRVRYRPQGVLEYIGRVDDQVKIRGFRIELGGIEALLLQHEGVEESAVVAASAEGAQPQLIAYVVVTGSFAQRQTDREQIPATLLAYLHRSLPPHSVPSKLVVLPQMPRTPNGKVDRKELRSTEFFDRRALYVAPRNDVERELARIWESLLKVASVGVHDNFFALGGYSLLATQVTARIKQHFGVDLTLREFLTAASLEAQANSIASRLGEADQDIDLMERLVAGGSAVQ